MISVDIKVIAMGKQQILIRVGDELGDWLDNQADSLGVSKPQLILSLLSAQMLSGKEISNDIIPDIKSDSGVSRDELEQKCSDIKAAIDDDINELSIAMSVVNNDVGSIKDKVGDISTEVKDINADIIKRLEIVEQWIASRPKSGRPRKTPS